MAGEELKTSLPILGSCGGRKTPVPPLRKHRTVAELEHPEKDVGPSPFASVPAACYNREMPAVPNVSLASL